MTGLRFVLTILWETLRHPLTDSIVVRSGDHIYVSRKPRA